MRYEIMLLSISHDIPPEFCGVLLTLPVSHIITKSILSSNFPHYTVSIQTSVDIYHGLPSSVPPTREPAHIRWRPTVSAAPAEPASIPAIPPSSKPVPEALEASMLALRPRVVSAMIRLRGTRVVVLRLFVSVIALWLRGVVFLRLLVLVRSWTAMIGPRWAMTGLVCLVSLWSIAACSVAAGLMAAK